MNRLFVHRWTLAAAAAALGAIAVAASANGAPVAACAASHLSTKMTVIPGSAGAGQIRYVFSIKNTGNGMCRLGNHPKLKLLKANGNGLPTNVSKRGSSGPVTIAAGHTKQAHVSFSPDIPSGGEPATGPCEPVAHKVRVTLTAPAAGSLVGPITPPTSVCGHGSILQKGLS